MATPTYAEIRDSGLIAIKDIHENGKHIGKDGRVYTKEDLPALMASVDWAESKISINSASGGIFDRTKTGVPYRA
jgi:hypothetical protein